MSITTETVFRVVRGLSVLDARTWLGLVAADSDFEAFLADLESEILSQMDLTVRIVRAGSLHIPELRHQVTQTDEGCVALIGLEDWVPIQWRDLDTDRNALDRSGPILFCLTPDAAEALAKFAPNVRSYLGTFHVIGPDESGMGMDEIEGRLGALRALYGLSDQHVIERAQNGTLPPAAHFVEWLILLNRGDLV